jgi:hypothetical protein
VDEVPAGMVLEVAKRLKKRLRMCCSENKLSEHIRGMMPAKHIFVTLI